MVCSFGMDSGLRWGNILTTKMRGEHKGFANGLSGKSVDESRDPTHRSGGDALDDDVIDARRRP